jgi:hypothetical protein
MIFSFSVKGPERLMLVYRFNRSLLGRPNLGRMTVKVDPGSGMSARFFSIPVSPRKVKLPTEKAKGIL